MGTKEILKRLDILGDMLYKKCGTDSYEARCYLYDTKELLKQGQSLPIDSVSMSDLKTMFRIATQEQRQELVDDGYCYTCLIDEKKHGKCYCNPIYDI